jgi:endonuclease/exonuclease/phosphatase family metal-dependent hydrolase
LRGYGEDGDDYYGARYQSVFDRAEALGLRFVGPEYPHGRQAEPWPRELPLESKCVPTYYGRGQTPNTATRQLDFVFASASLAGRVHATALNDPRDWGPSDHCPVLIDIDV